MGDKKSIKNLPPRPLIFSLGTSFQPYLHHKGSFFPKGR